MALASEVTYFPSLDKCLAGKQRVISFKTAYRALVGPDAAHDGGVLQLFLQTADVVRILASPLNPFAPAAPSSKTAFETATAPIHVSQATNEEYDLDQLKADALWLSQEAKIEELAALRMAVIEWMERTGDQLLVNGSNTGLAVPRTESFGASLSQSQANFFAVSVNAAAKPAEDFASEAIRRSRLLRVWMEEVESIMKIAADLVSRSCIQPSLPDLPGRSWIDSYADTIRTKLYAGDDEHKQKTQPDSEIRYIAAQFSDETISVESRLLNSDTINKALFLDCKVRKVVAALKMVLSTLHALHSVAPASLVRQWFDLMDETVFLQNPQYALLGQDIPELNYWVSLISLSMLGLPRAIQLLGDDVRSLDPARIEYPNLRPESRGEVAYIKDQDCLAHVSRILASAANNDVTIAGPTVCAWGLIMHKIVTIAHIWESRNHKDKDHNPRNAVNWAALYETLQETMDPSDGPDLHTFFMKAAVDRMQVYELITTLGHITATAGDFEAGQYIAFVARETLCALVRQSMIMVPYSEDVLEALLAVLGPDTTGTPVQTHTHVLTRRFLDDTHPGGLKPLVLDLALARYPYELSPLLRLLALLASAHSTSRNGLHDLVDILDHLRTLTVMMPLDFRSYRLTSEDEGSNEMELTQDLDIFRPARNREGAGVRAIMSAEQSHGINILTASARTRGLIVREGQPKVMTLEHQHSGLEFIGLLLVTALPNSDVQPALPGIDVDRSTAAEIVALINALLTASFAQRGWEAVARHVISQLGRAIPSPERDIVSTVAELFEMELLAHLDQAPQDGSLDLIVACAEFLDLLVTLAPERTWSLLARSTLLGVNGGASALAAVVGGTEAPTAQYRFLAACTRLYSHLVDDAIGGLVERKAQARTHANGNRNRFGNTDDAFDFTPDRTMNAVLTAYQRVMLDAFQNMAGWRFTNPEEKQDMAIAMADCFELLLRATYGLEEPPQPPGTSNGDTTGGGVKRERVSSALMQSAGMVVQAFVPQNGSSLLQNTLNSLFADGVAVKDDALLPHIRCSTIEQTRAVSSFACTLVRVARSLDVKRAARFSTEVLNGMPVFATLLVVDHAYKASISTLLAELVQAIALDDKEPASILSSLSPEAAKSFLAVVSELDRPLCDVHVEAKMWDFLSTVLGSRQQWFALYLLTGSLPKTRLLESPAGDGAAATSKSLLAHALDELTNIAEMAPLRAKAMLKFVAMAQDVWIWATSQVRSAEFLGRALAWLDRLRPPSRNQAETMISADEHQMAAYLCDILAVNLHAGLETGDRSLVKQLVGHLTFLQDHAAKITSYNRSLHTNLAANVRRRYADAELADFQRTPANPAPHGDDFTYDVQIAAKILNHDSAWDPAGEDHRTQPHGRHQRQGFVDEFKRANANLSLVDAQMNLLKSWKTLCTTLCECVEFEAALQPALARSAEVCLILNREANMAEPGAADALSTRAQLAFIATSKLTAIQATDPRMRELLPAAWDLVKTSPVDYDVASGPEDLEYYRTLLQVLYLAVQPHVYLAPDVSAAARASEQPPPAANAPHEPRFLSPAVGMCLVDIVRRAIAPGFRALCRNLHADLRLALPGDFALLTALLQGILSVAGVNAVHAQIADAVAVSHVVRGALSLFSWADQLAAATGRDPVYGEVAATFLLVLSGVGPVAEQMALDGVLGQLANANLSDYFRKRGGKTPFDEPRRMFGIWAGAFLPLCLNLLAAVGPPLAADVARFLNSFPEQLARAETALQAIVGGGGGGAPGPRAPPHQGDVTLGVVAEAHSLLLIGMILKSDVARGAADGINAADVPGLDIDLAQVKALVEALPRSQASLVRRIVATNEREAEWARRHTPGGEEHHLAAMIVEEMHRASRLPVDV